MVEQFKHFVVTDSPLRGKLYHVPLDRDFEEMLISAERYACGRMSYIVIDTIAYIKELLPLLSGHCITIMIQDIEEEIAMCERIGRNRKLRMECDHQAWISFKNELKKQLEKREKNDL